MWFVALNEKKEVLAFMPLEVNGRSEARINNYYLAKPLKTVFRALMDKVVSYCNRKYNLSAVVLMQHRELFEEVGFLVEKEWRLYVKMEYGQTFVVKTAAPKKAGKAAVRKTAKKAATKKTAKKVAAKKAPKTPKKRGRSKKTEEQIVADRIAAAMRTLANRSSVKKRAGKEAKPAAAKTGKTVKAKAPQALKRNAKKNGR